MPLTQKFQVLNKVGLHARPAAKFVKTAASLKGNKILIENLTKNSQPVNAKSFTSVLSISVQQNDEVLISVDGENADEALKIFKSLFNTKFGESE
jgi:phosphotransferase system HPr (HPr) family protein